MIELTVTSIPFVLRILYLRWRGMPITLYNVHMALFAWLALAFVVFFTVFYYYPKSYTGFVPFRTVPVVSENGGTVTRIAVDNGTRVEPDQLLFTVSDATEQAAVRTAELKLAEIEKSFDLAEAQVRSAQASLDRENASLRQAIEVYNDQEELRRRDSAAYTATRYEAAVADKATGEAKVAQAQAFLDEANLQLQEVLPAQRESANAALEQAQVELEKTVVRSQVSGMIDQLTLHVGARASQIATSPAMLIIPDRDEAHPKRVFAGFSQVARSVLYVGMPAEVACDTNFNVAMVDAVLPARILAIQPEIAAGQVTATGRLLEPSQFSARGEVAVLFEMVYPEHKELLVNGSGCIVQTYDRNLPHGVFGHILGGLGIIKAWGLRIKVWIALVTGVGLAGGGH
ncbi:HlyD family secretion protein [Roseibium polysiphoniae]|uniref:HlyD family secretion protein n=1 Tax=Roseibium polysiphoniae TaxID=2571221 RepID=A0A944GSZ5_9HYPH|nr:HlyD family secretion protein [Roseibium polysiphoniae]MBS8260904.1 HlyD family secretion protein [Roseibium polysiphoniae]